MTSDSATGEAHLLKFQRLLRELFQYNCADLDFGIYRIMNHKRDAIEKFISENLPAAVSHELDNGQGARQAQAAAALKDARHNLVNTLGDSALDPDGDFI